jgi:hypothetical protein
MVGDQNPKVQIPNPKEIPKGQNLKIPKRRGDVFSSFPNLVIGFSLGFGAWDLELLAQSFGFRVFRAKFVGSAKWSRYDRDRA